MTHLLMDCSGDGWPLAALTADQAAALDLAAGQHTLPPDAWPPRRHDRRQVALQSKGSWL